MLHDETCEIDDDENMEIRTETHHKQSTNTKVDKIDHKCDICEKTCASGFSLKRHINNVHGKTLVSGDMFFSIEEHVIRGPKPKIFKCDFCPKT